MEGLEVEHSLILEGFPSHVVARVLDAEDTEDTKMGVARLDKLWKPGQELRVAFLDGDDEAREAIEMVAQEWTKCGNLKLSFRDAGNTFREWVPSDGVYTADIRIAFTKDGYWSFIGTDCVRKSYCGPGHASMNLQGFGALPWPRDGRATVLHEFGHALGFDHEHQNPNAPGDFRFHDDKDYEPIRDKNEVFVEDAKGRRPGLVTYLGGPPNNWDRSTVLRNLEQFVPSENLFYTGPFDAKSVMVYALPPFYYKNGEKSSAAYISMPNSELSPMDKAVMSKFYPMG